MLIIKCYWFLKMFYFLGIKYPERDPSLKGNWRGKARVDKTSTEIIEFERADCDEESEEEDEEEGWNENALRMALQRGMSMWRSHTGKCGFTPSIFLCLPYHGLTKEKRFVLHQ